MVGIAIILKTVVSVPYVDWRVYEKTVGEGSWSKRVAWSGKTVYFVLIISSVA
jgi:hypothetical protein